MALVDLKSDLSWYGRHSLSNRSDIEQSGYIPNKDKADTKFTVNNDLSVSTVLGGFDDEGFFSINVTRTSQNEFQIDSSLSDRGIAKRKAQLGLGSRFPISPQGNIHEFTDTRTGNYSKKRYSDTFDPTKTTGLADTYTTNSPIDDMYNKFKVREEAFNPFGDDKSTGQPYILRGIQRNGKSDPQYWGLGEGSIEARLAIAGTDIPRGGMVVYADRYDNDLQRLNKWRKSPHGRSFAVKQLALNAFNPMLTQGLSNTVKSAMALGIVTAQEEAVRNKYGGPSVNTNRLVLLKRELLNTTLGSPIGFNGGFVGQLSNTLSGGFDNPLGNIFSRAERTTPSNIAQQFSYDTPFASSKNNDPGSHGGQGRLASLVRGRGLLGPPNEYATTKGRSKGKAGFCTSKDYKTTPWKEMPSRATSCNPQIYDWTQKGAYKKDSGQDAFLAGRSYKDSNFARRPDAPHTRGGSFNGGGTEKKVHRGKALSYQELIQGTTQKDTKIVKTGGYSGQSDYMKPSSPSFSVSGYKGGEGFKARWDVDSDSTTNYGKGDGMILSFKTDAVTDEQKFKIYLTGLSEEHAPSWNGEPDQGRADNRYLYESYERTVNISFIVNGGDRCDDFGTVWGSLEKLAQMTQPVYENGAGFRGQLMDFTLGSSGKGLYYQCKSLLTNLSFDWDPSEGTWEIDEYMMPMRTAVDMSLIILGNQKSGNEGARIEKGTGGVTSFQIFGKDLSAAASACGGGDEGGGNETTPGLDPISPTPTPNANENIDPATGGPNNQEIENTMTNTDVENEPLDSPPQPLQPLPTTEDELSTPPDAQPPITAGDADNPLSDEDGAGDLPYGSPGTDYYVESRNSILARRLRGQEGYDKFDLYFADGTPVPFDIGPPYGDDYYDLIRKPRAGMYMEGEGIIGADPYGNPAAGNQNSFIMPEGVGGRVSRPLPDQILKGSQWQEAGPSTQPNVFQRIGGWFRR